ncbi:MAG: hypothetical protein KDC46_09275 [Thermoleophilia bacterium]|nr:hypothetical protein [Thermoleophilia bacterium]
MRILDGGGSTTPALPDAQRIQVCLATDGLTSTATPIGDVDAALTDPRVTAPERRAIRNELDAIARIRASVPAGSPIAVALDSIDRIVLRAHSGPAAITDGVSIPEHNPFDGMDGVRATKELLPLDVALHETTHLVQEVVSGAPIGSRGAVSMRGFDMGTNFDAKSVAEGLADARAVLELHDWTTGSGFLGRDGSITRIRDYAGPAHATGVLSTTRRTYAEVRHRDSDPHVEGGAVVQAFRHIALGTSFASARSVLDGVLADQQFASSDQAWFALTDALRAQSTRARDRGDEQLARAVDDAVEAVGLPE